VPSSSAGAQGKIGGTMAKATTPATGRAAVPSSTAGAQGKI
jgi:hypothetical protein